MEHRLREIERRAISCLVTIHCHSNKQFIEGAQGDGGMRQGPEDLKRNDEDGAAYVSQSGLTHDIIMHRLAMFSLIIMR